MEGQLSFEDATLRLAAASAPAIATPVVRWRKVVRKIDPPRGARVSPLVFQSVASALADFADKEGGSCFPSVATLAACARVSERSVQYALRALERWGLIRRVTRGGRGHSTRYQLICPGERKRREEPPLADRLTASAAELADSAFAPVAMRLAVEAGSSEPEFWTRAALAAAEP